MPNAVSPQSAPLRSLDTDKILVTAESLRARVEQRFPESGLSRVSAELALITSEAAERARWLTRPNRWVRSAAIVLGVLLVSIPIITLVYGFLRFREVASSLADLAQGIDAGVNEVLLLSAAIYFLLTFERRLKRNHALKALHELRALAHIIDMHQLTKDPEVFASEWQPTRDSPVRTKLTPFLLERYLDYCSEMLAVLSKVAALYVQHFADDTVLRAVDEVENLTASLSRKIWQKITILDHLRQKQHPAT
ncbi:MAG TPA: hypothetical protein VFD27_21365 [Chthoniobacteraceae bacterium]|nr:hypothetical protein [Chthoniobacteraceae bacterium]